MHEEKNPLLPLRVYLFGRQEIWRGGKCLPPLATQKTQSLLAYLIFYRHQPHSRPKLAALFWGDCDDVHAHHSLATALWRIRKQLGGEVLCSDSEWVQFNPFAPLWLDVEEFEDHLSQAECDLKGLAAVAHLEKAAELYRGDLLEGFYDDWCLDERYRLESLYLQALRRLINWHDQQGNATAVLLYVQPYLTRDPLTEEIHLSAMRAYRMQGDELGARRQWQRCCEARLTELHLSPSPAMIEQAKEILGTLFALPWETKPFRPKEYPRLGNFERSPFVGRAVEMEYLITLWEKTLRGHGNMVFLAGEAGIGKTRLAEEFSSLVLWKGGLAVHGYCFEPERCLPLQPIREILQGLLTTSEVVLWEIPEWERKELTRLLPEIDPRNAENGIPFLQLQPEQQTLLFQSVVTLIHRYAKRIPLLLVIEDLHWASDTTLAALHFLSRQISPIPVLILGTFRPEEIELSSNLERMIARLVRSERAQILLLERLSREAISELILRMGMVEPYPNWVEQLYAYTEGNAFYTIEMLRAFRETPQNHDLFPIPKTAHALIRSRLGQLSPLASKLITCAAVAGRSFDFGLIRLTTGINEDVTLEGIEELLRKGFLREGSSTAKADYEFTHQIVQEVAYREIHYRRRCHLHRKIGEALEDLFDDPSPHAASLAFHFDKGGNLQKALRYHHLAAQRATAVFAWQEAEQHQSRVLEILANLDPEVSRQDTADRYGKLLAERAELHYLQGNLAERDQDLETLKEIATRTQNSHLQLQALMRQTCYLNLDARYVQAIAQAEEGISLAEKLGDNRTQSYLLSQLGFAYYFLGKPRFALQALDEALSLLPEDDCETRRHIMHIRGYVYFHIGNYILALENQQQAYCCHQKLGDYNGMVWAGLDVGAIFMQMGQLDEAEHYIAEHLDMTQRMGACSAEAYGLNQLGNLRLKQGNDMAAIQIFRQSLSRQEGLRTEHGRVAAQLGLGFAYYHLGSYSEACKWLQTAIEAARRIAHRRRLVEALIGLGLTEIAAGNFETARLCLSEAVETARDCQSLGNLAAGLAALARLYRKSGETEAALWFASEALQISRQLKIPVCEMWAELEIGLSHLAKGDKDIAMKHTQCAVERLLYGDESWIGREQVFQAYAFALRALGDEQRAKEQELLKHQMIEAKTAWIDDAELRTAFLKAVNCAP